MSNGTLILGEDIEKVNISGTKTWIGDTASKRPESITINLLANGDLCASKEVKADKNGVWKWEFSGMPRDDAQGVKIVYTIEEIPVSGYETKITRDGNNFSVVNTYNPELQHIRVKKVWDDKDNQDGIRPQKVTVKLLKNDEDTGKSVELNAKNGWRGVFSNLAKKDEEGKDIRWTLQEDSVKGYKPEIKLEVIEDPEDEDKTLTVENSYVVTNTHTPETVKISGSKIWNDSGDQDGKRPGFITIEVYKNGEEKPFRTEKIEKPGSTENDTWNWSIDGLPKRDKGTEILYTVKEVEVEGYTTSGITGSMEKGFVITNTHAPETVDISGSKVWKDNGNQDGKRPESITIKLYKRYGDDTVGEGTFVKEEKITSATPTDDGIWRN